MTIHSSYRFLPRKGPSIPPPAANCVRIATNQRGDVGSLIEPDPPGPAIGLHKWTGAVSAANGTHQGFRYEAAGDIQVASQSHGIAALFQPADSGVVSCLSTDTIVVVAAARTAITPSWTWLADGSTHPLSVVLGSGGVALGIGYLLPPILATGNTQARATTDGFTADEFFCDCFVLRGSFGVEVPVVTSQAVAVPTFNLTPDFETSFNIAAFMTALAGAGAHVVPPAYTILHQTTSPGGVEYSIIRRVIGPGVQPMTLTCSGWTNQTTAMAGVSVSPGQDLYQQYLLMSDEVGTFQEGEGLTAAALP